MRRRQFLRSAAAVGVASAIVAPSAGQAQASLASGTQAVVTSDGLHVRGGAGADQPIVASLPAGAYVDLLGSSSDGDWWRVASDASVGYVNALFLQPTGQATASGIFDLDLAIPYARQLTDIWCDPADLEMWLSYRQKRETHGGTRDLQSAIWDWETTHNAGFSVGQWDCSPFAVASAAHHWMPDGGFDHFGYDDPLGGSRVLAWLLADPQMREPSVALIWRGMHYVLVRGVRAIGDPAADPMGAQLLGFYVADPDPGAAFWLGADRFIPIDRWLAELFSPVSYLTPHTGVPGDQWQDRIVAIQRSATGSGPTESGQINVTVSAYG